jgi:hypothetical protein
VTAPLAIFLASVGCFATGHKILGAFCVIIAAFAAFIGGP